MDTPERVIETLIRLEDMYAPPAPAPLGSDFTPTIG